MDAPDEWSAPREWIFGAGQSKRIWNELYKVFIKYFVFILCRQGKIINILYCNNTPMPVSVDLIFDLKPFFFGVTEYEIIPTIFIPWICSIIAKHLDMF